MRSRCAFTARVIHSQLDLLSQPSAWYLSMASSHLCSLWSLKHLWILSHQYLLLGIPQCRWFLYAASQTLAGRPSCSWRDWSSFFTWLYLQSTGQSTDLLPLNFYSSPKKCQAVADIVGRRSDFSLQKLPSCSWGDWRFWSSFATLPHRPLSLLMVNCLYYRV